MKISPVSNIKNELSRKAQSKGSNVFGWSFILSQQHLLRPDFALGSLLPDEYMGRSYIDQPFKMGSKRVYSVTFNVSSPRYPQVG